jgi:hypothetical protein
MYVLWLVSSQCLTTDVHSLQLLSVCAGSFNVESADLLSSTFGESAFSLFSGP